MKYREQSSTANPLTFLMVDASDHLTGLTGLTPTVELSKNGGAFAAAEGAVSEIGHGWYALAGDADDRDTLGDLLIHAEATGADPVDDRYAIVPWDIAAIETKTAQIGAGAVSVLSAVADTGAILLYAGDDYLDADGRAITYTIPLADVPDLTGATIKLCAGAIVLSTTNVAGGSIWTVKFEAAAAVSRLWAPARTTYVLEATLANGHVTTITEEKPAEIRAKLPG